MVPEMVKAGDGYRFHVTGLTHDERGYPEYERGDTGPPGAPTARQAEAVANGRAIFETEGLEDAEVVVVSYGITSRVAQRAMQLARSGGFARASSASFRHGRSRSSTSRELAGRVKAFVVPELNLGQMVHEVERAAAGKAAGDPRQPRGRYGTRPRSDSESHCGGGAMNERHSKFHARSRRMREIR